MNNPHSPLRLRASVVILTFALLTLFARPALAQSPIRDISSTDKIVTLQTNRIVPQLSGHRGYDIGCFNNTGGTIYLHFFDTNGLPGNGAVPNAYIPVILPTASQATQFFEGGLPINQGLVVCASTTPWFLTLASTNCGFHVIYRDKNN